MKFRLSTIADLLRSANAPRSVMIDGEALAEMQRLGNDLFATRHDVAPTDTGTDNDIIYYELCY